MALLQFKSLTFEYPGNEKPLFDNVSLELDTSWRLGLIGRNGRGKTTLLNLLRGKLSGTGEIISPVAFEYFPLDIPPQTEQSALSVARGIIAPFDEWEADMHRLSQEGTEAAMEEYGDIEQDYANADGYTINELIAAETSRLELHPSILERPFRTLSGGEQVKLQLAALFLKKHRFLLIDEPTDHLDTGGRRAVARWLATKSGFILVSHDRDFLDEAVTHILSINREGIELQKGNYSSWKHNRDLQDQFELAQNKKLEGSIAHLKVAAARTERWSDKIEKTKKGGRQVQYNGGPPSVDKGYVGHQAARMMQRSKSIERRQNREIEEKQQLLKNIETNEPLIIHTLPSPKAVLLQGEGLGVSFGGREIFHGLDLQVRAGERIAISGANGSGKTSLLKLITGDLQPTDGRLHRQNGLVISTLNQHTDFLQGTPRQYALDRQLDLPLFLAILRKLNLERETFERDMQNFSAGQKKKVCIAASLATPAHLFLWDEPLNYIDLLSREQIEQAVLTSEPTMIFVEHDASFVRNVSTRQIMIG